MMNIVLETPLDSEQKEHLEIAQRCAYSLLALLNDILDVSKIEAGRMELEKIPFDLPTVLDDSLKTHSAVATQKGVSLRSELDPSVPQRVEGDPLRLRQILVNLLSNAVKFTADGSVVLRARACAACDGNVGVEISITDTGVGIPADKQDQIFDVFTQADASTSRKYGGTGLGLTITRSLIEMQGGTITVQSEPGHGSTFTVRLAYAPAPREERLLPVIQQAGTRQHKHAARILVVEDNVVNQKLLTKLLTKNGYYVAIAVNGEEALGALNRDNFDLVLMDVQMPVMDGLEATRMMRNQDRWRDLPIVAMTARAMEGDKQSCFEAGMNGYISKPIHVQHLMKVVEQFTLEGDHKASASA
jgi:CheY-like chemotaxis protein